MSRNAFAALNLVVMIVVIVGVDLTFFRGRGQTQARLLVNVGIVLVDAALYFFVFRRFLG